MSMITRSYNGIMTKEGEDFIIITSIGDDINFSEELKRFYEGYYPINMLVQSEGRTLLNISGNYIHRDKNRGGFYNYFIKKRNLDYFFTDAIGRLGNRHMYIIIELNNEVENNADEFEG